MAEPVTDPRLLKRLNSGASTAPQPVTDPAILRHLNAGTQPAQPQQSAPAGQTVTQRAQETFQFQDFPRRSTLAPFSMNAEGEREFAWPDVLKSVMPSLMLPGHVTQGGRYSIGDVANFALDAGGTAARGSVNRIFRETAPTSSTLKAQARQFKKRATDQGVVVKPTSYLDLMADMETMVRANKLNDKLHPKAAAAFEALADDIGKPFDIEELMTARRIINIAQRSVTDDLADERRIAGDMAEMLDDFVDNLDPKQLQAGHPLKVGKNLREFRSLWHRARKADAIDGVIEAASLQASGFENGLRTQFRALLKDPKRLRGFTKAERETMKQIVEGTGKQKLMRLVGKLSVGTRGGSNALMGSLGAGAAFGAVGPLGPAMTLGTGYAAQKIADANADAMAQFVRAMAATGGAKPNQLYGGMTPLIGGPLLGSELRRPPQQSIPKGDPRPPGLI